MDMSMRTQHIISSNMCFDMPNTQKRIGIYGIIGGKSSNLYTIGFSETQNSGKWYVLVLLVVKAFIQL
jgi:hypothetical protein